MKENIKTESIKIKRDLKDSLKLGKRLHKMAFQSFKWIYLSAIFSILLVSVLPYISIKIQGQLIDAIIAITQGSKNVHDTYPLFFTLVTVLLISNVAGILRGTLRTSTKYKFRVAFSDKMVRKYSSLNLQHYENPELNDKLQRSKEWYDWLPQDFLWTSLAVISDVAGIIASIYILITFAPKLIVVIVLSSIPGFVSNYRNNREDWEIEESQTSNFRDYWETKYKLQDEFALQEIWIFKTAKYLADRANKVYTKGMGAFIDLTKKYAFINVFTSLVSVVGFIYVFWYLIDSAIGGLITIGTFTFYLSTARSFDSTLSSLLYNLSSLLGQVNHIRDIFSVIDLKNELKNGTKKLSLKNNKPPLIEFKNVWFKYPKSDRYIYKDFNLTINPGENVALVGKNGAGKSTFVKLLCRFYDVSKGEILIDGKNVKELDLSSWYKYVALLSQDFGRYHYDAKTNIGLGDYTKISNMSKIMEAAKKSGAHEFIEKEFKNKYNQVLSKRFKNGTEPSVGQWQKIALARAFFKDAPVFVLDEPTSAIDPKSEFQIFNKIFRLDKKTQQNDKSILIISHRFSTVRNANKIIVMDKGKIVEQGTHDELSKKKGIYQEAFDIQKKGYE